MKKTSFLGLIILIIFYGFISILLDKCAKNKQEEIEYRGILKEVFLDANNRNQYTYRIQTNDSTINQTVTPYSKSFDYTEVGDSIIKEKGKLQITIKKKESNFSVSATFPYE